jgi:hypothetical protein
MTSSARRLTQRRFNMTLLIVFATIAVDPGDSPASMARSRTRWRSARRRSAFVSRLGADRAANSRIGACYGSLKPVVAGLANLASSRALRADAAAVGLVTASARPIPVTLFRCPLLLAVVAFLAGLFPALRASRIDPLEALRVD